MSRPTVTVAICTFDRPAHLERCLRRVAAQDTVPDAVIVADNRPSDPAARLVAARAGARHVAVPTRGVSRSRNAAARACATDLLVYLDDDMAPHRRWLSGIVEAFAEPRVAAAAGPVLPAALADAGEAALQAALSLSPRGAEPFVVDRASPQWLERAHFGGIGDGNMAFRREIFARWRGFEERIGRGAAIASGEEHLAFAELLALGHAVAYRPDALVFHEEAVPTPERRLARVREAAAYATFAMLRDPAHAACLARYLARGAAGIRPAWRRDREPSTAACLSPVAAGAAFARGIADCLGALAAARLRGMGGVHPRVDGAATR